MNKFYWPQKTPTTRKAHFFPEQTVPVLERMAGRRIFDAPVHRPGDMPAARKRRRRPGGRREMVADCTFAPPGIRPMLKDRTFQTGLALFAVVAGTLIYLLWPKSSGCPSIGGGGYDLSGFVYTLALLAFSGLWTLVTVMVGMSRRDAVAARRWNGWAAVGAATFVVAAVAFGHNLR